MNTNEVADEILLYLNLKHPRVYRNKAPQSPVFPYVVYRVGNVTNSYPSEDFYLNIDIYDDVNASVRTIEDLADLIDGDGKSFDENNISKEPTGLNLKAINTDILNLYFDREQRQYIEANELVSAQAINIRYVVRAYFK